MDKLIKCNRILTVFLLLALSFMMPKNLKSQIVEVGAVGGLSYYIGDLNTPDMTLFNSVGHFHDSKPSLGMVVRYYQNLRWAFRFQYSHFNVPVFGEEKIIREKNKKNVEDFALLAEFNFFDYWTGSKTNFVTPYFFAGVSSLNYSVLSGNYNNTWSVPMGFGVKCSVYQRFGMTLEWRMHKMMSDNIDAYEQGSHAWGYDNDWIGTLELSLVYSFSLPKKANCHSNGATRK